MSQLVAILNSEDVVGSKWLRTTPKNQFVKSTMFPTWKIIIILKKLDGGKKIITAW